jgi:light-regulated signal transduction histidine kinase (bacteriophytochrome)
MTGQKVQYFEIYNEDVDTWFDVSVFPASGGGLSIYFRNITERVKHQQAIEAKNKKLSEIAWLQSHVVRAPLSTMMGLINLIQNNEITLVEKESLIAHMVSAAHELDKIITKIAYETYKAKTS